MPWQKPKELREQARQLRHDGESYRAIAKTLGASTGTIYKWLNKTDYD